MDRKSPGWIPIVVRLSFMAWALYGGLWSAIFADDSKAENPAEVAADQLEAEVKHRIEELQSDRRAVRVAAEESLKKIGPDILEHLPVPELLSGPAARESVRRIRIFLERELAKRSAETSTITLIGDHTLAAILAEFNKQTKNVILFDDLDESTKRQTFDIRYAETPFWSAWDDIVERAKLSASFDRQYSALRLAVPEEDPKTSPIAVEYAGPFRLSVTSVRRIDQIGETASQRLRINVNLLGEPRLRPLFLKYSAADVTLSGENEKSFASANPQAKWDLPWGTGETGIDLRWDFLIPPDTPAMAVNCQGTLHVEMAAGTQRFAFDDLSGSSRISQRRGGVIVGLEKVETKSTDKGADLSVRISVQYDAGGPAFESHRNWMFHNRAALVLREADRDADSANPRSPQSRFPDDLQTERQGDGTFVITYRFDNLEGEAHDYRFEYQAPTLLLTVPVKFSLPKIDIPGPQTKKERP
ncbi:MAG: hypothetical protein ACKVT0_02595 [Planctomycetaceae bacterium]